MPQVLRAGDRGPVTIDVRLLEEIEAALTMDTAEPRSKVAPVATKIREELDAGRDPGFNADLVAESRGVHDWLGVLEVDAIQRLRGWHRARNGNITVEAEYLADARNILDYVTLAAEQSCEQMLNQAEFDPELHAQIKALIDAGKPCGECEWCVAIMLRDRIDELMDAAGFYGGSYYHYHGRDKSS